MPDQQPNPGQPKRKKIIPIAADASPPLFEARKKIQSRSIAGFFASWRWIMVWVTQLFFYGMPWLQWGERQSLLFDLQTMRFYLFGLVLYPQDFIYLAVLLIVCALALFLFTTVAGRLWCGFSCPQTVYTEIFMWLARIVSGGQLENLYRLQIMNATEGQQTYRISAQGLPGLEVAAEDREVAVGPTEAQWLTVRLRIPYGSAAPGAHKVAFAVQAIGTAGFQVREPTVFQVPD